MKRLLLHFLLLLLCIQVLAQQPPKREMRGAWIATFSNIDWPNRTQTPAQQRAAFITIADHHKATGINTLYIQVRSQCDALYPSSIEPWSADLTGTQGVGPNPAWDPMQFMIDECHKRGMEFHAWINPYRAVSNTVNLPNFAANHVAKQHPEWLLSQGTLRVLDPGLPAVRDHITSVIADILQRYDVDGIHFDDYFYPPAAGSGVTPYNDDATYAADPRGFTNRGDWRRDNVSMLIARIYDSVKNIKPWVKFGVSPSGIYRNSTNPNIGTATSGLEHYTTLYADTKKWLQQGWVDYIAPQVYWYIGQPGANYAVIVPWWNNQANGRHIYIGMAGYKVNDPAQGANWANPSQIPNEVRMNRDPLYPNIYGQAIYNTSSLRSSSRLGFRDSLRLFFYQKPALLPAMRWRDSIAPEAPALLSAVKYANDSVVLNWIKPAATTNELDKATRFVIYRSENEVIDIANANNILAITPADTTAYTDKTVLANTIYYYTVTGIDHFHNESNISNTVSNQPPVITCPGDKTIYLDAACNVSVPDYKDAVLVNGMSVVPGITLTQSPAAGTVVNGSGELSISLTATDAGGNADTCGFKITIVDTIPPVITTLDTTLTSGGVKVVTTDSGRCTFEAGNQLDIIAHDSCDASLAYTYTLTFNGVAAPPVAANTLQGVIFPKGSTLVSWTVTDDAGNVAAYSYTVTVEDHESPLITGVVADPAQLWPPNHLLREVTVAYAVTDNCSAVTNVISVTSNEPVTGNGNGNTSPDWIVVDEHHVKLRAERSGGNERVYIITITSTDAAGNISMKQVPVTVPASIFVDGILIVKALPNPTPYQFIVITLSTSLQPLQVKVTDHVGRIVETKNGIAANGLFYLGSNYTPGIYFMEVVQGNKKQTIKLIKQGN